jgi:pimeloyl-ACP methyl ester carboxylesterase
MRLAISIALCVGATACSTGEPPLSSEPTVATSQSGDSGNAEFTLRWTDCDDSAEVECATLTVPYDYGQPASGSFELHVRRRPAADPKRRIGSLLVNPGGPGFGGSNLADDARYYLSAELLAAFDVVGWDPRGTGRSTPAIDCIDDYDPIFGLDATPDTEDERLALLSASESFVAGCLERSAEILPHVSTVNAARDMDVLRRALGEDRISYFGFSYGSELGAVWASLFPDTVRAAVLDGAVDPASTSLERSFAQAMGFERQLDAFLSDCARKRDCAYHSGGSPELALDRLLAELDERPLVVSTDRTPVTQGVAYTAIVQSLYTSYYWGRLASALASATRGDGSGLLSLYDDYFQRRSDGTFGNELEAFIAISCLDDPGPTSVDAVERNVERYLSIAPRLGGSFAYGYLCALWPEPQAERSEISARGAGPIVVIGTTGDAATPIESSRRMAAALEQGVFVIVEADEHTGYGLNRCVVDAVDTYLIEGRAPKHETRCS